MEDKLKLYPHRRFNVLNGEWILVSPQRSLRPWQGKVEESEDSKKPGYDPDCYLCPGNLRANGEHNPPYKNTFVFTNDYSAILPASGNSKINENDLFVASPERGICRVVCFSPRHNLTLAEMDREDIGKVIDEWINEFNFLREKDFIKNILIFENKGEMMGNSNPHPHCQIWAQESIPSEVLKEDERQRIYHKEKGVCLLCEYSESEIKKNERVILSNEDFLAVIPFWAVWPFETMILPLRHYRHISELSASEIKNFADVISRLTSLYDKLFKTSFPYSSGIHQAPVDRSPYPHWHFHMHFYPPLLRSAKIKKYMVGYELLANPQRDISPEEAAERMKTLR